MLERIATALGKHGFARRLEDLLGSRLGFVDQRPRTFRRSFAANSILHQMGHALDVRAGHRLATSGLGDHRTLKISNALPKKDEITLKTFLKSLKRITKSNI